jgi:hypothetical protein
MMDIDDIVSVNANQFGDIGAGSPRAGAGERSGTRISLFNSQSNREFPYFRSRRAGATGRQSPASRRRLR